MKAAGQKPQAVAYLVQHRGDPAPVTDALQEIYDDHYPGGVAHAAEEIDLDIDDLDEEDEANAIGAGRSRIGAAALAVAAAIVVAKTNDIADALVTFAADNAADAVAASLANDDWAETWAADAERCATVAGEAAAYHQGDVLIRIVAEEGACEFCAGYDGRILAPDDTDGLPPLHSPGCDCGIEAITPEESS